MRKHILRFFISGLLLLGVGLNAYAWDSHDFQIWNIDVQEFKLTKKIKATFEEEFRWGDNSSWFYYQHYDLGFAYTFKDYLSAGFGFREIYDRAKGPWKKENQPYLIATLSGDFAGFSLDSRNRLEYKNFDYDLRDYWRYRNKFTARLPWKFTRFKIRPFISDEIFARFIGGGTTIGQNRLYGGLGFIIFKNFSGEVYYLLDSVKTLTTCKWVDANVFGTKIKAAF